MKCLSSASFVLVVQTLVQASPEFKKSAANFMTVGFNKGRTGTRVTELAVTVKHREMFEGEEDVAIEDLILEVKADNGCWNKVEERPVRRGREKSMWRVKVVPCKKHFVRIGLKRDGCVEYFQYPEAVGAASAEEIANSHFRPRMPEKIAITPLGDNSVFVTWRESECAESYDLWYESDSQLDLGNMTVRSGVGSVTVTGLENCTEYTIKMVALVGEEFSDETDADFSTCQVNSTDILDTKKEEKTDVSLCDNIEKQCELITPRLLDFTSSVIQEDEAVSGKNKTVFEVKSDPEAQTGQASSSYNSLLYALLTQLTLLILVF